MITNPAARRDRLRSDRLDPELGLMVDDGGSKICFIIQYYENYLIIIISELEGRSHMTKYT